MSLLGIRRCHEIVHWPKPSTKGSEQRAAPAHSKGLTTSAAAVPLERVMTALSIVSGQPIEAVNVRGKMSGRPEILFKYVSRDGARKIIEKCSLRFARPSEMNDPFDLLIDDLYNNGLEEIQRRSIAPLFDRIETNPEQFASVVGADCAEVRAAAERLKLMSPETRVAFIAAMSELDLDKEDEELALLRTKMEPQLRGVIAQFRNAGIFCATRKSNNLLMWAHYAEQHHGAVLGFRPDLERDSFLRVFEPVRYGDILPSFYGPFEDAMWNNAPFTQEMVTAVRNALVYSKSTHWAYEEEVRIFIPNGVREDESAAFLNFYPSELCEVYLGCRMDAQSRSELISLAKALNPDVALFDMQPDRSSYVLGYISVSN